VDINVSLVRVVGGITFFNFYFDKSEKHTSLPYRGVISFSKKSFIVQALGFQ